MATENAIYLHHERTATADLESDLQYREVGIDPVKKMLTAYSQVLSAKIHAITEESPSPTLLTLAISGVLGVSGATTLAALSATTGAFSSTLDVTGSTRLRSTVGFVGAAAADTIVYLSGASPISSADQTGIYSEPTFSSAATSSGMAFSAALRTAASAYTMTAGHGLRVFDAVKGAGSTITTLYGLKIENQTQGTTNYAIHTGQGLVLLGGAVSMSSTLAVTGISSLTGNVNVNGATNTSGYGINLASANIGVSGANQGVFAFGVGAPTNLAAGNTEYVGFYHSGSMAYFEVGKTGSGSYHNLSFLVGGVTPFELGSSLITATVPMSTSTITAGGGIDTNSTVTATSYIKSSASGLYSSAGLQVESSSPALGLRNTSASADNKWWDINAGSSALNIRAVNDAGVGGVALSVERSGNSITALAFGTAATKTYTFYGEALVVPSVAGSPSPLSDLMLWYNSSTGHLCFRQGGVTIEIT